MQHKWVPTSDNSIPPNAFRGGYEGINILYVARAVDPDGNQVGGKASSTFMGCYITHNGCERQIIKYEVLTMDPTQTKNYVWKFAKDGQLPKDAVRTDDSNWFVARVAAQGTITPGKFMTGEKMAKIPFGGDEFCSKSYEILCYCPGDVYPNTAA